VLGDELRPRVSCAEWNAVAVAPLDTKALTLKLEVPESAAEIVADYKDHFVEITSLNHPVCGLNARWVSPLPSAWGAAPLE
jgi:hypothetical protein